MNKTSLTKPFVQPRKTSWWERHPRFERNIITLGAEFLGGCIWSLSLFPLAFPDYIPRNAAILYGAALYILLSALLRTLGHVAISGAFVTADLFFDMEVRPPVGRPRLDDTRDTHYESWARLLMQATGTLVAYGFVSRICPNLESGMTSVWEGMRGSGSSLWTYLTLHFVVCSFIGGLSLRCAQIVPKKNAPWRYDNSFISQTVKSGIWCIILTYPWGGPSCSIISFVWVARVYQMSDLTIVIALVTSIVAQGIGAKVISEILWFDSDKK